MSTFKEGQKVRVTEKYAAMSPNMFDGNFQAKPGMIGTVYSVPEEPEDGDDYEGYEPSTTYSVDFPGGGWDVFESDEIEEVTE